MQQMLENGEIDLLTSARRTGEREQKFDYSRPIGTNSTILTIRSNNTDIVMHDYDTYTGMRVAMLQSNSRNTDFDSFAQEHGFTYTSLYFSSFTDMTLAL